MSRECAVSLVGLGLAAGFCIHVPLARQELSMSAAKGSAPAVMPGEVANPGKEGLLDWNKQVRCAVCAYAFVLSVPAYIVITIKIYHALLVYSCVSVLHAR